MKLTQNDSEQPNKQRGILPKVDSPYPPEQAVQNGDIVDLHGNYSNFDAWKDFLKNLETKQTDTIRITSYSIEGDPIFYELFFNGKEIEYTFDNSMDAFAGQGKGRKSTLCTGIMKKTFEYGERYILNGCGSESIGNTFSFEG
jgi:hypothetical protein